MAHGSKAASVAAAAALGRTPRVVWPVLDPLLPSLQRDPLLREHASPLYTPCSLDDSSTALEEGRSYVRVCPKFAIRTFVSAAAGERPTRVLGAVYFSNATAGSPPGCVHGGALATAMDCIVSDLSMFSVGWETLFVTRSLSLDFRQLVPVDTVCRFECWREEPRPGDSERWARVRCALMPGAGHRSGHSGGAPYLAECACVMASAGGLPEELRDRLRRLQQQWPGQGWAESRCSMPVPATDEGCWPAVARAVAERLISGGGPAWQRPHQHPTGSPAGGLMTMWDMVPGTDASWDVGRPGAAADVAAAAVKIMRRVWWRRSGDGSGGGGGGEGPVAEVAGVYIFTSNAMGPPGRAHGGAVASAFDEAVGLCCACALGLAPPTGTSELEVRYLQATPLLEPVVALARVVALEGHTAQAEAVLVSPGGLPPGGGVGYDGDGVWGIARQGGRERQGGAAASGDTLRVSARASATVSTHRGRAEGGTPAGSSGAPPPSHSDAPERPRGPDQPETSKL